MAPLPLEGGGIKRSTLRPASIKRSPPRLSLDEEIAQLLVVGFDGKSVNEHLLGWLDRGVGGVILFRRNIESPEQILKLCQDIHRRSRISAPMISIDQEPGLITRLSPPFSQWSSQQALGKSGDAEFVEKVGAAIARELKSVGVNTDWAPVMDVQSNSKNPIIGPRSFGGDVDLVSKLGRALIKGLQGGGVAACAKHFPGHGDTSQDSHLTLPVVSRPKDDLEKTEIPPFAAAVRAGVASVMTAHVLYPAWDKDHPATLSPRIITGILRDRMKFKGVIVTDDLSMVGIAKGRSHEEIAAGCIEAGCDILLACQDFPNQGRFFSGVKDAVESGRIAPKRVQESLRRIWALKNKFCSKPPQTLSAKWIGSKSHQKISQKARALA